MRADIQGLRGIAVLLVVLYHAGLAGLSGGYVGVDVFFVISGYLITGLLAREMHDTGRIDVLQFLARRVRRLLPASLVLIVGVVLLAAAIYPSAEQADIVRAARAAALYAANLWFASQAVDYLGGDANVNPLLHMWSLGVEEQFYLVWPWLLVLAARGRAGADASRRLLAMVMAVTVVTFVACWWVTRTTQPWAFFGTPLRAWEFGLGAAVWLARSWLASQPASLPAALGWAGAALVLGSAVVLGHGSGFPGPLALIPAGGTALILAAAHASQGHRLARALGWAPLVRAGDVSYSWYLWHWPALVMFPVLFPTCGALGTVAAVVLSYVAAEASWRWVEQPLRRPVHSRAQAWTVVAAAGMMTVALAGVLSLRVGAVVEAEVTSQQRLFNAARQDIPAVYGLGCHLRIRDAEVRTCIAGDPQAPRSLVLFGDSHAAHWYPALDQMGRTQGWRIVSITKSACPWVDTPVDVEQGGFLRPYSECRDWHSDALEAIASMRPDVVMLSSGSRYRVEPSAWQTGAQRTLVAVTAAGATAVVLHDTPWPGFNVPTCLLRADHRGADAAGACTFGRDTALERGRPMAEAERRAARAVPGVVVADPTPWLCPGEQCPAIADDIVRYSDHSHLSATYSRSLASALAAVVERGERSAGDRP